MLAADAASHERAERTRLVETRVRASERGRWLLGRRWLWMEEALALEDVGRGSAAVTARYIFMPGRKP